MTQSPSHYPTIDASSMVAIDQRARRHQARAVRRLFWETITRLLDRPAAGAVVPADATELTSDGRVAVRYDAIESLLALNDNDLARLGLDRRSLELYRDGAIKHLTIVA